MDRKIQQIVRDRHLTKGEAATYREVCKPVTEELPDLRALVKVRLRSRD